MSSHASFFGNRAFVSTVAVVVFLAAWEIGPRAGWVDATYTSQPSRLLTAGLEIVQSSAFPQDLWISFSEFSLGFPLATAIGVPLGLLLGMFPVFRYLLDPPIMAVYATPYLALLPILVVWLGIGLALRAAAAFIGGVIPIIVNSMAAVRSVDRSLVAAARSFCACKRYGALRPTGISAASLPLSRIARGVEAASIERLHELGLRPLEYFLIKQSQSEMFWAILRYGPSSSASRCFRKRPERAPEVTEWRYSAGPGRVTSRRAAATG